MVAELQLQKLCIELFLSAMYDIKKYLFIVLKLL